MLYTVEQNFRRNHVAYSWQDSIWFDIFLISVVLWIQEIKTRQDERKKQKWQLMKSLQ